MRNLVQRALVLFAATIVSLPGLGGVEREQSKPLVVVIYADWCPYCQQLKPVLALINEKYKNRINFVRLDLTSEATAAASRQQARKIGLEEFFDKNQERTSLVLIQDAAGHEIFSAIHDYDFQHYAAILDKQLNAQQKPIPGGLKP